MNLRLFALLALPAVAGAQSASTAPLLPGDRVVIRVLADTAVVDTARVDAGGQIVVPGVGRLSVGRLPLPDAVDSVRRAYAATIRTTAIEITPLRRVIVSGEVRRPGVFFLEPQFTIREAVAVAGGVSELGRPSALTLSRGDSRVHFGGWERRIDDEAVVHSGDVIWIGRESWLRRNALSAVSAAGVLLSVIVALTR